MNAIFDPSLKFPPHHTTRSDALHALRRREAELSAVFNTALVGIMHRDLNGKTLTVNERFCEILARTEDELMQLSAQDYTFPDDLHLRSAVAQEHAKTGRPVQVEKRYVRPDGSIVWCRVTVSFVPDEDDNSGSIIIVAQDITAIKVAESELRSQGALLQDIINSVDDLIFIKDLAGQFVLINRALAEGCGDLIGSRDSDHFDDELTSHYNDWDQLVINSGKACSVEEEIPINGEQRLFQTIKVPWIKGGEICGVIGVSRDITERKAAELDLRASEQLYRSVLEASADCIMILDADGRIELINSPGVAAMEFDDSTQMLGHAWVDFWPAAIQPIVRVALTDASSGKSARFSEYCPTAAGKPKWWDVVLTPMSDETGKVARVLAIARDVSKQRKAASELKWASEHDALTELPNRRAFEAKLRSATLRAMESGETVGLLLLDLDHFKHVNDTLGHAAGDHLLKVFAKRLRDCLRSEDFVARLGGDEFAVILKEGPHGADLVELGQSVLARVKQPIRYDGRIMSAGASIGGAVFPADASNARDLLKNADIALYALKASGRGGTKMFHQYMREQAQTISNQLSEARLAISGKTVEPHYQQKIDLKTGAIVGFEALLRWHHPRLGIQLPESVAEAFKEYELASKIGELMQDRVFQDLQRWLNDGLAVGVVALNAAPAEFLRDDFAERLLSRLDGYSIPPDLIEIEVTEHVFLESGSDYVARALGLLSNNGIRIALDDFGTGYSSLSHLRDYPVDVVKIDRSFVNKLQSDHEISAIVQAIIDLARSLNLEVVAEGIETEEQWRILAEKGCSYGQGFLFGRAVHADELPALLRA